MSVIQDRFPDIALNVVPHDSLSVEGVLIRFSESDLPALMERELGYEMIEVSKRITPDTDSKVYTFMAPNISEYGNKQVCRPYLELCLAGVSEQARDKWLAETIIECEMIDMIRDELMREV